MPQPKKERDPIVPPDRIYRDVEAPVPAGHIWDERKKDGAIDPDKSRFGPYKLSGPEAKRFLNGPEGTPWKQELAHLDPGDAEFNRKWQETGRKAAESFDDSQARFATASRFEPQADRIEKATGIDVRERSSAVQNVVFAGSMEHGPDSDMMSRAIQQKAQRLGKDLPKLSDEDIMHGIIEERAHMEPGFSPHAGKEKQYGEHILNLENDMGEELRANPGAGAGSLGIDTPVYASQTWQREAAAEMAGNVVQGELQNAMSMDPVQAVTEELKKSLEKSAEQPEKKQDLKKGVADVNYIGWMGGGRSF